MSYFKKSVKIARDQKDDIWKKYLKLLEDSWVFKINNNLAMLLSITDNDEEHLPFQDLFLDCFVEEDNQKVYGIVLSQIQIKDDITPMIYLSYLWEVDNQIKLVLKRFDELDDKSLPQYKLHQKLKCLIGSFLLFVNSPDSEFVERKLKPTELNGIEKKYCKGISDIVLCGRIKKYCDDVGMICRNRGSLTTAFWVRGHWRVYTDSKYVNMMGKKKWILPFIKGGIKALKKNYIIKN